MHEYVLTKPIKNIESADIENCDIITKLKRDKELVEEQLKQEILKLELQAKKIKEISDAIRNRNRENFKRD